MGVITEQIGWFEPYSMELPVFGKVRCYKSSVENIVYNSDRGQFIRDNYIQLMKLAGFIQAN